MTTLLIQTSKIKILNIYITAIKTFAMILFNHLDFQKAIQRLAIYIEYIFDNFDDLIISIN